MELSKSSLRYQEERAEDKESIKTKENEMKMVHKVIYLYVYTYDVWIVPLLLLS